MKNIIYALLAVILIYSCGTSNKTVTKREISENEAVIIENDSLEYKIIIMDVGFSNYLISNARPAKFYGQNFYENKNRFYITEWNARALDPSRYGGFYENPIEYSTNVDYGLDVNYKLYYYFKFCEDKYKIRF
jgi:hypothetical protein